MKTKNIFRMLLVAAALLMGANNVKADEKIVWEGKTADYYNGDIQLTFDAFTNKDFAVGQNLRVYASDFANSWSVKIMSGWSQSLNFDNWKGDSDGITIRNTNTDAFNNTYGCFEMTIGDGFNIVEGQGFRLQSSGLYVTKITLYSSGASTKQDVTLAFSPATATATIGEAFTEPTLTATANDQTVTGLNFNYSSSNTSVATVDNNGDVTLLSPGRTIISASFSGNSNYNSATASYTLNVVAAVPDGELFIVDMDGYDYRTYVTPSIIDFSRSDDVEGYYAKEVSGNNVVFYQITGKCAAGVPLLLKLTGANAQLWEVTSENATGETPSTNLLHAGPIPELQSYNDIYVLTYREGQGYLFAEIEFVKPDVRPNVGSSHAYLDLTGVSAARGFKSIKFIKGDTSGISDIETESIGSKAIYNLRGQRVERPTKGLYIINGKKVLIK